jgi:catechol 2,3-dioxygenase-like lactoylglutathione lyase family enzyme
MTQGYVDPTEQLVVAVFVRKLDRSLEFYRKLGFNLARTDNGFAAMSWEGHMLFLVEKPELTSPSESPRANLRIMVPDVERYWTLVQEMGARIVDPISDRSYGLREFTFTDPDGFVIRFTSPIPS